MAPRRSRAKFTSVIFVMSGLGALLGIWLGLLLTTPAEPWPEGLPFAMAGEGFENGWRWMYGVGAILALVAILLRFELPESPRWLVGQARLDEADKVVSDMEKAAAKHGRCRSRPPTCRSRRASRRTGCRSASSSRTAPTCAGSSSS
jgi:putative MFS transporter